MVWAEVCFPETSTSSPNWSMILRDWECPGHDVSEMFTLPDCGILDLAPCALPWNAHHAQGLDHLFQRQFPKHPVVLSLLSAEGGKAANVFWSGRRNEKLSGHRRGKSWWCPWEEHGALDSTEVVFTRKWQHGCAVIKKVKGRKMSDCQNGAGLGA